MNEQSPRPAAPSDAEEIAAIHVQSWQETYPSLLPSSEIARYDLTARNALWQSAIASGRSRIALIPGCGFAAMGPQRDAALAASHPEELLALYVLRKHHGQGHGKALLAAVQSDAAFTTWVLAGNTRAERFYSRRGGIALRRETELVDGMPVTDILLSFPSLPETP